MLVIVRGVPVIACTCHARIISPTAGKDNPIT
jgi:hypothetical protein